MITALLALAVMAILAAVAMSQASTALRMTNQQVRSEQALYMANAGVELILAKTNGGLTIQESPPNDPYPGSIALETGLTGYYSVAAVVSRPGFLSITSIGWIERDGERIAERTITAEIPFQQDEGSGETPEALAVANGPLNLQNNADICGDLIANGNLTLGNNVTVWDKTDQQDEDSPCTSILGTGKAVATGVLTKGNNTVIMGGWCDATHFGSPYPCSSKPEARSTSTPDFPDLKSRATRWWVKPSDATFCDGKPSDKCKVLSGGELFLSGSQTYADDLIYVDGDLSIDELRVTGNVTFAATGAAEFNDDLTCSGGTCNAAVLVAGNIDLDKNKQEVWATLFSGGTITSKQVTVHGNISAGTVNFKNGVTLYPSSMWPVGLPGNPSEDPESPEATPPPGYSDWSQ